MSQDKARLRAMQALGKLLPADDSGKMEERAIKGYIELLELSLSKKNEALQGLGEMMHQAHLLMGSVPGEHLLDAVRRVIAENQKIKGDPA